MFFMGVYSILFYFLTDFFKYYVFVYANIDGLVQDRRNTIANALELRLSCTDPSILSFCYHNY